MVFQHAPEFEELPEERRKGIRSRIVCGIGLMLIGIAMLASGSRNELSPLISMEEIPDTEEKWTESECSEFDDDTVYTNATCKTPDEHATANHCVDGGWCYEICGTMCDEGSCAVCTQEKLSNMTSLCEEVHSIKNNKTSASDYSEAKIPTEKKLQLGRLSAEEIETHHRAAWGCDAHTWCEYCETDCKKVVRWEQKKYEEVNDVSNIGTGPASMEALNRIEHWCVTWRNKYD